MPVTIRDATPEDLADIVEFNCLLAQETEDKALQRDRVTAGVTALLDDPDKGHYWLAMQDGRVVGQIMTTREWSDWRNGLFWWVQSVYVRDSVRGQGVFSALYRHVAALARDDPEVCGIRLYVEEGNHRARRVYETLGMHDGGYRVMEIEFEDTDEQEETP